MVATAHAHSAVAWFDQKASGIKSTLYASRQQHADIPMGITYPRSQIGRRVGARNVDQFTQPFLLPHPLAAPCQIAASA